MSKIAEALAKAKERTGNTTAPFLPGQIPTETTRAKAKQDTLRKAAHHERKWLILLSITALLAAALFWTNRDTATAKPPRTTPGPAPIKSPEPEPSAPAALALPPRNGAAPAFPTPEPRTDTYRTVNELVISAVLPGEKPRIMHQGRIINAGEDITAELIFAGIQDGQIVFNDRRGAIYLRRY